MPKANRYCWSALSTHPVLSHCVQSADQAFFWKLILGYNIMLSSLWKIALDQSMIFHIVLPGQWQTLWLSTANYFKKNRHLSFSQFIKFTAFTLRQEALAYNILILNLYHWLSGQIQQLINWWYFSQKTVLDIFLQIVSTGNNLQEKSKPVFSEK